MKIAIPSEKKKLSMHFGHCSEFDIFEVDMKEKKIIKSESHTPPPHEPGVLPAWLAGMNVEFIIAGGMGQRAINIFKENNIDVMVGVQSDTTVSIIEQYLEGSIESGANVCDH